MPLSPEALAQAKTLHESGQTWEQVAQGMGLTRTQLVWAVNGRNRDPAKRAASQAAYEARGRVRKPKPPTTPEQRLARALVAAASRRRQAESMRDYKPRRRVAEVEVLDVAAQGLSLTAAAQTLGMTPQGLGAKARKLGVVWASQGKGKGKGKGKGQSQPRSPSPPLRPRPAQPPARPALSFAPPLPQAPPGEGCHRVLGEPREGRTCGAVLERKRDVYCARCKDELRVKA